MSVVRRVWLVCDHCEEPFLGDIGDNETVWEAREATRATGNYVRRQNKDWHRDCWEFLEEAAE